MSRDAFILLCLVLCSTVHADDGFTTQTIEEMLPRRSSAEPYAKQTPVDPVFQAGILRLEADAAEAAGRRDFSMARRCTVEAIAACRAELGDDHFFVRHEKLILMVRDWYAGLGQADRDEYDNLLNKVRDAAGLLDWNECTTAVSELDANIATYRRLNGPTENLASLQFMLAKALYGCGKWNDALFVAEMDLETFRGGLGEVHPWTAMLYHLIGAINSGLGRYDRVLQAHSRACRIWAACGKTDTSEYVFTALQTAECLIALKEFDRARACIGAANDVRTRLDSNHLCTLQALITECNLLHRTDRTQDAIAMATKANIFAVKELWDDHQAILMSELDKCDILLAAGRTEAAEPVLSREYAQIDKYGEGPCDLPRFHLVEMYARLLLAKGEFIESERLLRGAIEIVERKQSPRHPMLRHVLEPYAIVLDKLGRHEEAKRMEARREAIATSLRKAGHRIKADPECTFPWEE